ncbi:hypothetical protein V1477_008213 [Vespula maculifrons]|uniref:Uncharacterized protein n=1 Tax=Vespula maculifrons TaxID=7453 RepID=A0ABD2CD99_VESMC
MLLNFDLQGNFAFPYSRRPPTRMQNVTRISTKMHDQNKRLCSSKILTISCIELESCNLLSHPLSTIAERIGEGWASPTCTLRLFRMKLADDEARFVALFSSSSPFSMTTTTTTTTTMTTNDDDDDDESVSQERADVPQARRRQTDCHAKT